MTERARPLQWTLRQLEARLGDAGARLIGEDGAGELLVSDVFQDSRRVETGALFVVRSGNRTDGRAFVEDAVKRGAVAVLCEPAAVDFQPRIEVADLPLAWALAAHAVQGDPSEAFPVVGITGTNGKTTTACLLEQALTALKAQPARIGTLGYFVGGVQRAETLTTPQADDIARYLADARRTGATHMVTEVSSHALAQGRVLGVRYAVAAFVNLSQDHLDYHGTLEDYAAAKRKLLDELQPGRRVINVDDVWGARWASELATNDDIRVSVRGHHGVTAADSDVSVERFTQGETGLVASIRAFGESVELRSRLIGEHNLQNLMVALGCLIGLGYSPGAAAEALEQGTGAPGRFERCDEPGDDLVVLVDYAHSPDALRRALEALGGFQSTRITCVFGCGGDRDRGKRAQMGEMAVRHAQRVIVTSDNPRTEPPEQIIDDIRPGLAASPATEVVIEPDRAKAIERAIAEAVPGEVVLLAGKGHETYQILADRVIDFDDRVEARRALRRRRQQAAPTRNQEATS